MAENRFGGTATRFVDDRFQHQQRSLETEQQRQEHRLAALQMGELRSFARATEFAEDQYARRLQRIERGYGQAADKLHKQQTGLVGRMQAMTKAGREVQATQGKFLDDRARELRIKAHRAFEAAKERQFEAAQAKRLKHAEEMRQMRQDHAEQRQAHAIAHGKNRPGQIEERTKTLQRVEESRILTENFNTRSDPLPLSETPRARRIPTPATACRKCSVVTAAAAACPRHSGTHKFATATTCHARDKSTMVARRSESNLQGKFERKLKEIFEQTEAKRSQLRAEALVKFTEALEELSKSSMSPYHFKRDFQQAVANAGYSDLLTPVLRVAKLPTVAPALWLDREDKQQNPATFIEETYAQWLGNGLTRAHILHLDKSLYNALAKWLLTNDLPIDLPTKAEQNTRDLEAAGMLTQPTRQTEHERLHHVAQQRNRIGKPASFG